MATTEGSDVGTVADKLLAPVAVIAADSTLLYVNAAAAHAIGQEPAWLIGRRMLPLVHPDDRERVGRELRDVIRGRRSGGVTTFRVRGDAAQDWRVFESIADNLLDDPTIGGILLSSRDITQQLAHEEQLRDAAYRDALTGLASRAAITEQLARIMATDRNVAVGLVGLDRFRLINDSLGHTTGDAVLNVVGARVLASVPSSTIVGRFGGDVMALLVAGPAAGNAARVLWRVVERLAEPMFIDGHELRLASSAGVAQRDEASTADSLVRDAGLALHRAKAEGGGRVTPFQPAMREEAIARLELEANLRRAITEREFRLAFQPIVELSDASPVGCEALVRWHHERGSVDPAVFIPVAEETGLIVPLGHWIIDDAARRAAAAPGGRIMVNLSARQLAVPGLPDQIARVLATHRADPASLGFEVTETLLIEHFDYMAEVLCRIRQLGCRVGLDDFGTGYSSLGYLRRLPIDFLKIDGSLTADVDSDPQARAIVGAIITMADALGIDAVAEGVETEAQASTLRDLGCVHAQGFLFGRPVELDNV